MYKFNLLSANNPSTSMLFNLNKRYHRCSEIPYYSTYTNSIQSSRVPHDGTYPISLLMHGNYSDYNIKIDYYPMTHDKDIISPKLYQRQLQLYSNLIFAYNNSVNKQLPFVGLVEAPCGFGKSETTIKFICDLKVKTVIIVKTRLLVTHWMKYFEKYKFNYNGSLFGSVDLLEKMPENMFPPDVLIVVSRHLENPKFIDFIESNYSLCIIDEIHLWNLSSTSELSKYILLHPTPIMLYLTATPNKNDKVFYGEIFTGIRDSNINNISRHIIDYNFFDDTIVKYNSLTNHDTLCDIQKNSIRNQIIVTCILIAIKNNTIVFCIRRRHMEILFDMLKDSILRLRELPNSIIKDYEEDEVSMKLTWSDQQSDQRSGQRSGQRSNSHIVILKGDAEFNKIHDRINQLNEAQFFVLITTSHLCATGVNLPSINTIMIAAPHLNKTDLQQAVGRSERGPYIEGQDRYVYLFHLPKGKSKNQQLTHQTYISQLLLMKQNLIGLGWKIKK